MAFGVKLTLHGMFWRPFDWQELLLHRDVYLATVVAVPHFLLSFATSKVASKRLFLTKM